MMYIGYNNDNWKKFKKPVKKKPELNGYGKICDKFRILDRLPPVGATVLETPSALATASSSTEQQSPFSRIAIFFWKWHDLSSQKNFTFAQKGLYLAWIHNQIYSLIGPSTWIPMYFMGMTGAGRSRSIRPHLLWCSIMSIRRK